MGKKIVSYYDVLGVNQNATKDEIIKAFAKAKSNIFNQKSKNEISDAEYVDRLKEILSAYDVLIDDEKRASYDEMLVNELNSQKKQEKQKKQNTGATEEKQPKKNKGLAAITAAVVACGLALSVIAGMWNEAYLKRHNGSNPGSSTTDDAKDDPKEESTLTSSIEEQIAEITQGESNNNNVTMTTVPEMVNYGDPNDSALVTQRATQLSKELIDSGLYNVRTNAPYTTEEIKTLIEFINGVYVPANETEAFTLVDYYLDLALAPLNSEHLLYAVQYQGGEDSFKDILQDKINNYHKINFVDNMLLGDSTVGPYLKWFENQYNRMICTTDRAECKNIYENMIQSLADIVYGDGYLLDGKIYKEQDFLGLDKINSGNVLQLLVYMMEPLKTETVKDTYTINNKYLSAKPEEQKAVVYYDDIVEHFNALCANDLVEVGLDDKGLLSDKKGENFSYINQVNTVNQALINDYAKNNTASKDYTKELNN